MDCYYIYFKFENINKKKEEMCYFVYLKPNKDLILFKCQVKERERCKWSKKNQGRIYYLDKRFLRDTQESWHGIQNFLKRW